MLDQEQARALCTSILARSKADECHVSLSGGRTTHLRFARNSPSTSGEHTGVEVSISSVFGKRTGSVTINQVDDASLTEAVRRSEEIARLAPEDREHMAALPPQTYASVDHGFDPDTAERGAERLAAGVGRCLADATKAKLVAAGFTETNAGFRAIATSSGNFGYHRSTGCYAAETARTADGQGSGWASASAVRAADLDYAGVSAAATRKAAASVAPRPLAPGSYVTILEPACVANLVGNLAYSMGARSATEGRSYFSTPNGGTRLGETLFGPDIDIYSDPMDPVAPGTPWGNDGLPQRRVDWCKGGVLTTLRANRYWAQLKGVDPVPMPSNLIMKGGTDSIDDLVASTERGVLVTSLWYIRSLDPRTMLYTGLTRDGVFWIENGKIAHPVTNFRWNDSPIAVLKNVVGMSRAVAVPPRPQRSTTTVVPALKVKAFNFASVSEAV